MRASRHFWTDLKGWMNDVEQPIPADLVLYFGSRQMLGEDAPLTALKARFPDAALVGCSTGGQIEAGDVSDDSLSALALKFAATPLQVAKAEVTRPERSRAAGAA